MGTTSIDGTACNLSVASANLWAIFVGGPNTAIDGHPWREWQDLLLQIWRVMLMRAARPLLVLAQVDLHQVGKVTAGRWQRSLEHALFGLIARPTHPICINMITFECLLEWKRIVYFVEQHKDDSATLARSKFGQDSSKVIEEIYLPNLII
jgi:hypothetical protein